MTVPNKVIRNLGTLGPKATSPFLQSLPKSFATFMRDPAMRAYINLIAGADTDTACIVADLRNDLSMCCGSRRAFKIWVTDSWLKCRVNPVKRGKAYWQRTAIAVWDIYGDLFKKRAHRKFAFKREMARIASEDRGTTKKMYAARKRRAKKRKEWLARKNRGTK